MEDDTVRWQKVKETRPGTELHKGTEEVRGSKKVEEEARTVHQHTAGRMTVEVGEDGWSSLAGHSADSSSRSRRSTCSPSSAGMKRTT